MKTSYFGKFKVLSLIFILTICVCLFGTFASAETEPVGLNIPLEEQVKAEYGVFYYWQWDIRTKLNGTDPPKYDEGEEPTYHIIDSVEVNGSASDAIVQFHLDATAYIDTEVSYGLKVKEEWVDAAIEASGSVSIGVGNSENTGKYSQYTLPSHHYLLAERQPAYILRHYTTDRILQIRVNDTDAWQDTRFVEHIDDSTEKIKFVFQIPIPQKADCIAASTGPRTHDPETGAWRRPCKFQGCTETALEIIPNHPTCTVFIGRTCTARGYCEKCGKYGPTPRGCHEYDYSQPETTSTGVRFPCKYGCAGAYESHSHSFEDDKNTDAAKTNIFQQKDDTYHKRRYDIKQVCNEKLRNGATCGATKWRYDWRDETHHIETDIKDATCTADGYVKYTCSDNCGYTQTDTQKAKGHVYNYSRPEGTSTGYRFPCKYGCAGAYDYHSHNFEDDKNTAAVKTNNLQKNDATYHKRRYDIKQVCNSKLGNGATCGESKWRYDWRTEKHTIQTEKKDATCTADGYIKYTCSDNCGYTQTETQKAKGHVYDYSRPEGTSTGYRFPCKYGCAGVYDSHSHSFVDAGEAAVKTNNLQKSDATNHKRRYDIKQVCNQKWGNGAKCGATKWRYDWRNETHSLTNNGDATKTNTYQQISGNASQHNRKTTQPQKCACGYTKPKEGWIKESHSWHNDILAKAATCTTQGSRKRMCIYCDYVNTYSTAIDPNNHNWSGEPKCLTGASCTNGCGATKPALGHNYSGWTLVRTPTATDRGQLKRTCYRCGQVHYKPAR